MFDAGALTFREFMMAEPLPLGTVHQAVLEFLRDRDDVVLFGAQAVNAYVDEPRMTHDIDLLSPQAESLAKEIQAELRARFHIAVRIRKVAKGLGHRLFQIRKTGNRHLVDVRSVEHLPPAQRMARVLVMAPADLIASKVIAYHERRGTPKSGTDWRDLAMLVLTFPKLKRASGAVTDCLQAAGVEPEVFAVWHDFVKKDIRPADDDKGY